MFLMSASDLNNPSLVLTAFNVYAELYKMICSENDTFQDITISSVMLPNAAGNTLDTALNANYEGTAVEFELRLV